MFGRQMKTHGECHGSGFKVENEPEEGEIVDDYDLIVSSDEELSMRRRIRELEAENEEIEQIAVISRCYADKIHPISNHIEKSYAARMPTDVSSISSTEFITPKKRKRRKSKEHKRKHCNYQHQHSHHHQHQHHVRHDQQIPHLPLKPCSKKAHCKRRQKLFNKGHQKSHSDRYTYKKISANAVSLESLESSDSSSSLTDSDSYSRNYLSLSRKDDSHSSATYITRDTLRLAVARNSFDSRLKPKKSCLKDKLLKQEHVPTEILNYEDRNGSLNNVENDDDGNVDDDDDDDVQVIETEPDIQTVDEDSTDSMEEKELRLIALKSAVLKKHMARKMRNAEAAYSPTDFDEMLSSGILQPDQNIEDLDVVDLGDDEDSQNACIIVSPEASPQLKMLDEQEESQQMVDCKPIDMDIANSDSEDTTVDSWSKEADKTLPSYSIMPRDFSNQFQYGFYMHDLHNFPLRPPPPPGVDDYEETPPAPPFHKFNNSEIRDMELDNEECAEMHQLSEANSNYYQDNTETKLIPFDRDKICSKEAESEDEEEEEALRALLLSKFQSPKNQIKCRKTQKSEEHKTLSTDVEMLERSIDNNKLLKPTEFILKEAVKRLKIHSQSDNLKGAESVIDSNGISQNSVYQKESCKENNFKSSVLLATLRHRLLKSKDQNKTIDHEENVKDMTENLKYDRENYAYEFDGGERGKESEPLFSNNSETTVAVDISDITRRLQKIKEDVLNKQLPKVPVANMNATLTDEDKSQEFVETFTENINLAEVEELQYENKINLYKPFNNNSDIMHVPNTNELKNAIAGKKTIEANFDVNTKQTTLRVTIKNIDNVKADDEKLNVSNRTIPYEENNVPENVKRANKADINNVSAETHNKYSKTKAEIKTLSTVVDSKPSIVKPVTKVQQAPAATPYSAVRPTKIVKPNKVINTNVDLKRREFSTTIDSISAPKAIRQDQISQSTNSSDNTRLITSIDQVKHMCKVSSFVISVQNSSNESSEDEWGNCDSLYKPLYDYNDNASPLSLNLESPSLTPLRSNSPTDLNFATPNNTGLEKTIELKFKADTDCVKNPKITTKMPKSEDLIIAGKTSRTPLAVRHLPVAAQSEYRRLVHRMMLLENKRKATITGENKNNSGEEKTDDADSTTKTSLVKEVLIRNASNNTSPTGLLKTKDSTGSEKFCKTNVLRSYENLYVKIGAGIVSNLDKSLKLVEEAKRAKTAKMKLENRIKKLKAEMEDLQAQHKEEQQKISLIYPSICTTNEVITSLKQKRTKIFKAAINLGKTLKGEDYRLNNDLKETINSKSKQLAGEIKTVNSLKIQDISNAENSTKPNNNKRDLAGNTNILKENKTKLVSENTAKTFFPDEIIDDSALKCKGDKENEEKCEASTCNTHTTQAPTDSQFGGNTEFQNLESNSTHMNTVQPENGLPLESLDDSKATGDNGNKQTTSLTAYKSPLEHLRNFESNMDPNGVVCPYDLMGNCEDTTCKFVHISPKATP